MLCIVLVLALYLVNNSIERWYRLRIELEREVGRHDTTFELSTLTHTRTQYTVWKCFVDEKHWKMSAHVLRDQNSWNCFKHIL